MHPLLIFRLVCIFFTPALLFAQNEYVEYRSASNPYYWKNRKPHESYWQQDVHYTIEAVLNDSLNTLTGKADVLYFNNSPHELHYLYFHLYNNAQTAHSYLADLYKNNNYTLQFGTYRNHNLGICVDTIKQSDSILKTELDNTILKVYLKTPLKSGSSVQLHLNFTTFFDQEAIRNRMKVFNNGFTKHFDIVHWYPRLSVYDAHGLWNTDQHMDHEFYGDFGSFHVRLFLPNHYICEGTGTLLNAQHALPDSLRKRIDITNFKNTPFNSMPSVPIVPNGRLKLWEFSVQNVHDVAYTADPTYRIGEVQYNQTRCIAMVQEMHAAGWQHTASFMAQVLEAHERQLGPYPYSKIIVADAQDGMEYPMLSLCSGVDPDNRALIIHELTHNWFQGMIGNNETYRAWMDEGLTQFFTSETLEELEGRYVYPTLKTSDWKQDVTPLQRVMDHELYVPFYNFNLKQEGHMMLNTHSDEFNGTIRHNGGYAQTYYKTGVMLKNLEYVLSKPIFRQAIRDYVKQWRFCHPYPDDFTRAMQYSSGQHLNWFFDAWLNSEKTIDYKVKSVNTIQGDSVKITLQRKGRMHMPLDIAIIDKHDSVRFYYIPNTWNVKPTEAIILNRWLGWDNNIKPMYSFNLYAPQGIKNIIIDPSYRMADLYMPDNQWKHRVLWQFDARIKQPENWRHRVIKTRPALWYNAFDGLKPGIHISGDYMHTYQVFNATLWLNTGILQGPLSPYSTLYPNAANAYMPLSYIVNYKTRLFPKFNKTELAAEARHIDGLDLGQLGITHHSASHHNRVYAFYKSFWRDETRDRWYLLLPDEWQLKALNSAFIMGLEQDFKTKNSSGQIRFELKAPAPGSVNDIRSIQFTWLQNQNVRWALLKTRVFMQYATAQTPASESMLFAAGANPEAYMNSPLTRAIGIIPAAYSGFSNITNHFQMQGGLNLRGYSGYLMPYTQTDQSQSFIYKGLSGWSVNSELESPDCISLLRINKLKNSLKLHTYLFTDFGMINVSAIKLSHLLADAGAGVALSVFKWGPFDDVEPFVLRADFPLWLNRLPFEERNYFQFRWQIGFSRMF